MKSYSCHATLYRSFTSQWLVPHYVGVNQHRRRQLKFSAMNYCTGNAEGQEVSHLGQVDYDYDGDVVVKATFCTYYGSTSPKYIANHDTSLMTPESSSQTSPVQDRMDDILILPQKVPQTIILLLHATFANTWQQTPQTASCCREQEKKLARPCIFSRLGRV